VVEMKKNGDAMPHVLLLSCVFLCGVCAALMCCVLPLLVARFGDEKKWRCNATCFATATMLMCVY